MLGTLLSFHPETVRAGDSPGLPYNKQIGLRVCAGVADCAR
ncbi:hypothetical protein GGD83_004007 [Rhodoblastus sphagnicola]|nr:hypothetical protein [Rhodoblastus sphagnicola]MBB4200180.1 hypothetical protein [Rhodoblastus sphagnicola]